MRFTHLLVIVAIALACEDTHQMSQEEELQEIERMREEIASISLSETCTNEEDWSYVGIGHKACGGPAEYVAYSILIDVDGFESLIEEYTIAQMEYNKRWGIGSDCSIINPPSGVTCQEGEPVLVYNNQ
ncbi:MAG: hypothetical protein RIC35_01170 [Marinoscillum sp.]